MGMSQPGMNTMGMNHNNNQQSYMYDYNHPMNPQQQGMMQPPGMQQSGMMSPPQQPGMQQSGMVSPPQQPQLNNTSPNGQAMDRSHNASSPPRVINAPSQPSSSHTMSRGAASGMTNSRMASLGGGNSRLSRPAFIDPTTNIVYECHDAEYEGWLTKQSMWLKDWRRRYVILKGNKLFFAKNEYQAPHGMIDLAHCTTVKSADWKSKKRHSFEISTTEITYLLYADTESEKDDWIGRVGKAIVRCSRTYVGKGGTQGQTGAGVGGGYSHQQQQMMTGDSDEEDDDDIYTNDDMENPYYND